MGNWNINIQGIGAHHNPGNESDAEKMAKFFVEALKRSGHRIEHASFIHGGKDDLEQPMSGVAAKSGGFCCPACGHDRGP